MTTTRGRRVSSRRQKVYHWTEWLKMWNVEDGEKKEDEVETIQVKFESNGRVLSRGSTHASLILCHLRSCVCIPFAAGNIVYFFLLYTVNIVLVGFDWFELNLNQFWWCKSKTVKGNSAMIDMNEWNVWKNQKMWTYIVVLSYYNVNLMWIINNVIGDLMVCNVCIICTVRL